MKRFEMVEDGTSKFWEVDVEGNAMTVRYGRIGSAGQTKRQELADEAAAQSEAAKLIRQKTGKGYVEVGGEKVAEATTASAPSKPLKVAKSAAQAPLTSPSSNSDMPSSTPRHGALTWVLASGGGRDSFAMDLPDSTIVVGPFACAWLSSGDVVRIDLATCERTRLGNVTPKDKQGYRSVALDESGTHWAVSEGEQCWLNGKPIEGALDTLRFGKDGSLWGFRGQKVVRVGLDGKAVWEGAQRGKLLAIAGEMPVVGAYAGGYLPDGKGGFRSVSTSHVQEPRALVVDDQYAVLAFWMQHEGTWCWRASIFTIATGEERVLTLPNFDGHAVIAKGRLHWAGGELDLNTGDVRAFSVDPLGSKFAEKRYGGVTLSPDGNELWQVLLSEACVRRFDRETRVEKSARALHPAAFAWSIAVTPEGRVVRGTDEGWEVFSPEGTRLRQEATGSQVTQLAVSPDGTRLAVGTSAPSVSVIDAQSFATLAQVKKSAGDALSFSPDGTRLTLVDESEVTLVGAADLQPQAVLKGKGWMRRAHFSGGRIVAQDDNGRAYAFEDPGVLPSSKKPTKIAPSEMIARAEAGGSDGSPLELFEGSLVVYGNELRVFDLASGKVVAKVAADNAVGSNCGRVFALEDNEGASLYRLGEATPFTHLPGLPSRLESTADGRHVVAALHGGLVLWSEAGGRTDSATTELLLPSASKASAGLPGFSGATQAFVVHAFSVTSAQADAERIARALTEEFEGLSVIPEGDPRGTDEATCTLFVGFAVAAADADAEQGKKGEKAKFEKADFAAAEGRLSAVEKALCVRMKELGLEAQGAADHLVTTGALSSAELVIGKTRTRISWEDPDLSATISARGAGTLVCWND